MDNQKTDTRKANRSPTITKAQINVVPVPQVPEQTIDFDLFKRNVIACGPSHALAIGSSEGLYGWGRNQFQQLGKSERKTILEVPTNIDLGVKGNEYVPVQVACGLKHSVVLAKPLFGGEAGIKVFTSGSNQNGRLGRKPSLGDLEDDEEEEEDDDDDDDHGIDIDGGNIKAAITQTVTSLDNKCILMVACGGSFSLALTNTGHIYSWGDGSSGALGLDTYDDVVDPRPLLLDSKKDKLPSMKFIAAGSAHSIGISSDGKMYGWGGGEMGQLGTLEPRNTSLPTLAYMPRIKIQMASCGMYNTMVVSEDQLLFGCGANKNGQLGFPDLTNRDHLEEVITLSNEPIKWVACGGNHTLVLSFSNKVFAFGNNNHLKCGVYDAQELGANITVPTQVEIETSLGGDHVYQVAASLHLSMAITKNGEILTWGKNSGGLLGRPTLKMEEESPTYNAKPAQEDLDEYKPGSIGSTFLKREGNDGDADKLSVSIKSIQCGLFHTVAVTNAGELYVWGSNEYGQHGQLTSDIQQAREAKAGKQNDKERLELPPECLPSLVPQFDIKLNKRVTSIGTGSHHIIAVENFRKIYAWGRNIEGQLGLGMSCKEIPEPTAIPELTGHVIREVAASEAHSLVLLESGEIYAFGSPLYGRLGIGLTSTLQLSPRKIYDLPKAMKIRCGPTHSMALVIERTEHVHTADEKEDYALYTWGSGWGGKLGQGHIDNCFVPTRVDTSIRFSEISCGENHSAGITKKGKLYIWGPREYFGVIEKRASDILGEYKSKLSDFYILKPTPHNHHLFENEKFSYVSLGNHYNLALSETNVLYKWGNFDKSYEEDFQKTGGHHAHATDKDLADLERVEKHCDFLKNTFESLPEMQDFIISIDATSNHAVAFSQRYAYSWGIDSYTGRLGHTKDHGEGEEGAAEAKDDAYDKRFDHPKIIKFLANILNKNTQKLNMQRQMEALDDAQSGKTKKSSRSKKSADSRRQLGHSKSTAKGSKLNASSMASIIDVNEDDETGGGSVVRRFIDDLRLSVEEHRYLRVINSTDELESIMKNVYQRYAELKKHINTIGHFSHSAETIIVKRLLSRPFSITPSHKHIYKLPKEFTENRVAYARLYTILQLHPCYIRNIYLTKKIDVPKLYTIIKEVFGDMEGDKRKTKLFMALCLEILREELKNKNPYALSYDSLAEDKNDTTPLFTRLFKLFMKSSAQNMTYLNLVEGRLRAAVEAAISSVTNKQLKPYALVFRREDVSDILEKYKNESDAFRHAEMEKIVKRVKEAVDKVFDDINKKVIQGSGKENAGDVKSKSISASVKYLLKKCVDITMETFKNTELVPDQIESKALALIFVPLREKLKKNVKKENNGNILSLTNAIIMYIKGVSFSSENQKWVTELNNSIRKGDDRRRKLFSWFRIKDYNFEEKLVKSTFIHSTELENDKIQCTIGNLAYITKFLKEHAAKVAVIHPQNLDYVAKFPEKLNQQSSYLQKDPTAQEAKMIVNLKLKTRQLLYGDSSAMKICNDCDAFLKESLVSTNSRVLVEKISKEDPRSLDTYYKNFLIDLEDRKIEQLLEGSEEFESFTKKTIENYKAMADYEKVGSIATFLRGLEEELQAKHPFIATYDSQKMNQVRYELVKELQSRLMSRLKLEVITLDEMEDHEMLFSRVKETVGNSCKTRNDEINNLKYILDAMKYGSSVQNPEADKIFSKNRQSMYSALKGQLSRTPQSKDLVENLNEAEKGNLKLFGKYSVKILRIKKILVEFYDPEFPNLNKKCKNSDKYSVIFTKSNKDIRISLIYTAKNATLLSLLLGSGKNSKDDFEEIVDETVLSEHDVLHITQSATKNKENPKIIKLGKFIEVNSSKFLELLNTLHSNQEIYDQQVMRTYNPKDVKKADIL